jgi:hypothetical protein
MKRKIKAYYRLSRRKGRNILENIFGSDCLSSGYISPEMHENFYRASRARKDARL